MDEAITPLLGHIGHWFEVAMFTPAVALVIFASIRSIREGRSENTPTEEK